MGGLGDAGLEGSQRRVSAAFQQIGQHFGDQARRPDHERSNQRRQRATEGGNHHPCRQATGFREAPYPSQHSRRRQPDQAYRTLGAEVRHRLNSTQPANQETQHG